MSGPGKVNVNVNQDDPYDFATGKKKRPEGAPVTDRDFKNVLDDKRERPHSKLKPKNSQDDDRGSSTTSLQSESDESGLSTAPNTRKAPVKEQTGQQGQDTTWTETKDKPRSRKMDRMADRGGSPIPLDPQTGNRSQRGEGFASLKQTASGSVSNANEEEEPSVEAGTLISEENAQPGFGTLGALEVAKEGAKNVEAVKQDSPFALFQTEAKSSKERGAALAGRDRTEQKTGFHHEQSDISQINPGAAHVTFGIHNMSSPAPEITGSSTRTELQALIDQLVSKLTVLETSGKTDTIVTLKHPPMFEGVNLVVSSFDSAKGEFNLSFENLTQQAKQVLDLQNNQNSLRTSLEQKGYAVHIITTTTLVENQFIAQTERSQQEKHDQGEAEDQQQQRQRQQETEEELG